MVRQRKRQDPRKQVMEAAKEQRIPTNLDNSPRGVRPWSCSKARWTDSGKHDNSSGDGFEKKDGRGGEGNGLEHPETVVTAVTMDTKLCCYVCRTCSARWFQKNFHLWPPPHPHTCYVSGL